MALYEFGFRLNLNADLAQEVSDTLEYMTRSSNSNLEQFKTTLQHPLFEQVDGGEYLPGWSWMISNQLWGNEPGCRESDFSEKPLGSRLSNGRLTVRRVIEDDTFFDSWYPLAEWLGSISSSTGLIGYSCSIDDEEAKEDFELLYKKESDIEVISLEDKSSALLNALIAEISEALA